MTKMTLSEELQWRGFVNQTTFEDITELDSEKRTFYWGVDPSAASMTIGNLAAAMMVRSFIKHGYKPVLLVGGATGLIGDPDGKAQERDLKTPEIVAKNKAGLVSQYKTIFAGQDFKVVDNYDWFKDMNYLEFLREVGKHVPMRQMLARDFVQSRLGEDGAGISYAEFSYSLIQGYDFLHLFEKHGVTMQMSGADQWGNCIAGVDLIRRKTGKTAHIWTVPLIVNKSTGVKFGKSEEGAVWLDPELTSPTQFYQFWINLDDEGVEDYLKVYTELDKEAIDKVMHHHKEAPQQRTAQTVLAQEVTKLVHGEKDMQQAEAVTAYLIGKEDIATAGAAALAIIRKEQPSAHTNPTGSIVDSLVSTGLATSNTEARRLIGGNAISINNQKVNREVFEASDFHGGRLLIRKGKRFKDSALIEI
ncbi:MAG: tyrosine--tRNA ligase [Candidatus Saccharimonadales bacterium]